MGIRETNVGETGLVRHFCTVLTFSFSINWPEPYDYKTKGCWNHMNKEASLNEASLRGKSPATEEHLTQTVKWLRKQAYMYYVD